MSAFYRLLLVLTAMAIPGLAKAQTDTLVEKARVLLHQGKPSLDQLMQAFLAVRDIRFSQPDTALVWSEQIKQKAIAIGEEKLGILCLYLQSMIYNIKGQYLLSISTANHGVDLSWEVGDDSLRAVGYNRVGMARIHMAKFDEALQSFNQSLEISEKTGDERGIATNLCSIGQLYYESQNFELASQYTDQVLHAKNNEHILLQALHTRANIHGMNGEFNKALELDERGLAIAKKTKSTFAYSMFYDNMANCYMELGQFGKAHEYFNQSLVVDSFLNNKKQMGDTYANLAMLVFRQGNMQLALSYCHRSIALNREAHSLKGVQKALHNLREIYFKSKMYDKAYDFATRENELKDSLMDERTKDKMEEFNIIYQTTRKEAEISLLKKQQQINELNLSRQDLLLQKRNYQIGAISGILVLLGLVGFLFYSRQQLRQRQAREKAVMDAEYKERMRIARDVHDDLGSGLSRISLMAELAKSKTNGNLGVESDIRHISTISKELVENMRDLVWVLNPGNTTLDHLISRIREYISDYLEEAGIEVTFELPQHNPDIKLPREIQRNIFLTVKEAIHNVVKHAHASMISLYIYYEGDHLRIVITDDGAGFDAAGARSGNGLRNMRQRIEDIAGSFGLNSAPGEGTVIRIGVPIPERLLKDHTFV